MKTITLSIRIVILALFVLFAKQSKAQCAANFTWSVNSNGNVSFTNLSTPSVLTTYTWNFGNGQTSNAVNPIVTYTANNTYDVSLSAFTSTPGCSSFTFAMITVTNVVSTCSANFNYSVGANGTATFISTSLGTNTATPYSWSFGNNTFTTGFGLSGMNASTAYTANGIYTIGLTIGSTVSTCYSNITQTISVTTSTNTSPCNLNQGSYGIAATNTSNVIYINSTPVGTLSSTTYTFAWGDGNIYIGSSPSPTHAYVSGGNYAITMQASNNTSPSCTFTSNLGGINMCGGATFDLTTSYSLGANGQVSLFSSGLGTTSATSYSWSVNTYTPSTSNVMLYTSNPTLNLPNGVYYVYLFAKNTASAGCLIVAGSNQSAFTVSNAPPCTITPAFTYSLQGTTTQFINQTSVSAGGLSYTSYTWSFGNGGTLTTGYNNNPFNYGYNVNGVYTVTLSASNGFCGTVSTSSLVVVTNTTNNACAPIVNFASYQGANSGMVYFMDGSSNVSTISPTYLWKFGDGISSALINPVHTYSLNGVYNVTLQIANNSSISCSSSTVSLITITNACAGLAAAFNYTVNGSQVVFNNASINTSSLSSYLYQWDVGNNYLFNTNYTNTPTFSVSFINGTYNVGLTITNATNVTCQASINSVITVSNSSNCNLSASFTHSLGGSGFVGFQNTSTGTNAFTAHLWNFGDGSSSNQLNPTHTYTVSGAYPVTCQIVDPFYYNFSTFTYCHDSVTSIVNVNLNPCPTYTAGFTHTLSSNGLVNFNDASIGTNSATTYEWNFGDGWSSYNMNPNHSYSNGGTHYVYHYIRNYACPSDSVVYAINVTGISCLANANFSVVPTSTAQYWNAFLAYPYNITGALWTWGDGSSSNTLYASHQYSAAANYSICLSVTASCGSTATSCYTYNIYKGTEGASNIISIDVLPGKAQLETVLAENTIMPSFMIYPNPNNGEFTLDISALKGLGTLVEIQDLPGKLIWTERIEAGQKQLPMRLNSGELQKGLYFIKVYLGETYYPQKLIIH